MINFHYSYNWRYPFNALKLFFSDFCRDIKWFFQRGTKGYANSDVWVLCDYYLDIFIGGLSHLKENLSGYPTNLTEEKWNEILQKMIDGFKRVKYIENDEWFEIEDIDEKDFMESWKKYEKEKNKVFKDTMKLFTKYFFSFWD